MLLLGEGSDQVPEPGDRGLCGVASPWGLCMLVTVPGDLALEETINSLATLSFLLQSPFGASTG